MPIKIPDNLPARYTLEAEGIMVMDETVAVRQDIRPLKIGLLNLMPDKIGTETQLARLIGATPLQVELTLIRITSHVPRHTSADHLASFYRTWEEVREERFDGFVVTGAPVERMRFEDVTYWDELCHIFDWTQHHVHHSLTICWAAQAAAYHFHGMAKYELAAKAFGVFAHQALVVGSPWLRGMSDNFAVPVSRWTEVRRTDIPVGSGLVPLAESAATGLCLLDDPAHRMLHMFNHLEYDTFTLGREYERDRAMGPTALPYHYFPGDNPEASPVNTWRSNAHLLFGNWINEIYQTTQFDIGRIGLKA